MVIDTAVENARKQTKFLFKVLGIGGNGLFKNGWFG